MNLSFKRWYISRDVGKKVLDQRGENVLVCLAVRLWKYMFEAQIFYFWSYKLLGVSCGAFFKPEQSLIWMIQAVVLEQLGLLWRLLQSSTSLESLKGFAVSLWSPASVVWEVKEADVNAMHVQNCLFNTLFLRRSYVCRRAPQPRKALWTGVREPPSCRMSGRDDVMKPRRRSAGPWDSLSGTDGSSVEGRESSPLELIQALRQSCKQLWGNTSSEPNLGWVL